jgi:hypothetical protein
VLSPGCRSVKTCYFLLFRLLLEPTPSNQKRTYDSSTTVHQVQLPPVIPEHHGRPAPSPEVTHSVTTGPLERSSCRIHLRGRCRDEVTDVASTPAAGGCADGVPSREVHVSKKSTVFLPSSLLRSRSLFWLRERRGESNAQVQDLNESDRVPAGVDYLSESWAKSTTQTEDSHWSANGRARTVSNKTGREQRPVTTQLSHRTQKTRPNFTSVKLELLLPLNHSRPSFGRRRLFIGKLNPSATRTEPSLWSANGRAES